MPGQRPLKLTPKTAELVKGLASKCINKNIGKGVTEFPWVLLRDGGPKLPRGTGPF